MRTFRYDNGSTGVVYETLSELLKEPIIYAAEDEKFFYIRLKEEYHLSSAMWKVEKETGEVSYIDYPDFIIDIADKVKEIDPETLRRAS